MFIDTNQMPAGSNTSELSFTDAFYNVTMQAFSLQGVDTNYVPTTGTQGGNNFTTITLNSGTIPNYGYWAALCGADANTGHPLTNSTASSLQGRAKRHNVLPG